MTKHDVALDELRRLLNTLTKESKYAADRRIWLGDNIRYDEERGRKPEPKHVKEFAEMDEKVRSNFGKIQSIIGSMDLLEEDNT